MRSPSPGSALRSLVLPKKLSLLLEQDAYVVFLDVDGVLNNAFSDERERVVGIPQLQYLQRIHSKLRFSVVVSSSWRTMPQHPIGSES